MSYVLYTAVFGGYDEIKPVSTKLQQEFADAGVDLVCFTDGFEVGRGWQKGELQHPQALPSHQRVARWYKVNASLLFPDAVRSIWIDGSFSVESFPGTYFFEKEILGSGIIGACQHSSHRRCIYREGEACKQLGKDSTRLIDLQLDRYKREFYPYNHGLAETGILLRDHAHPDLPEFERRWHNEISGGSLRDQLSFNYVAWQLGSQAWTKLPGTVRKNAFFQLQAHKNDPGKNRS